MVTDTLPIMTNIEALVVGWLNRHKIEYQFQTSLSGGFYELGGAVVDFLVEPNLAWRVMGEYWHQGVEKSGSDVIQREMLEAEGWIVIDLWGDDLENRLNETLTKAIRGEQML